ncbi:splicing factor 45 [Bacillus rossius redtenbacheri]|uniref:splicing factor 45 n=1 Tax=Bacillus rossius redtenbacheri TaxID=93214 RepID=UPI002FDD71A3
MSLYDDMDAIGKQKPEQVVAWSSSIKLLQSQLQLKKAVQTQPKRDSIRKSGATLPPVIDLKSKKEEEDSNSNSSTGAGFVVSFPPGKENRSTNQLPKDAEWNVEDEYDPMFPNDYEKVVKDLRELREREKEQEEEERRRKNREERERRARDRYENEERKANGQPPKTGFAGRKGSDEEDDDKLEDKPQLGRTTGAAIAPPASLQESPAELRTAPMSYGASVAAKIMAKYGFKEGQGLGKKEQGIASALQVEKTSKRGGRIIHEKDLIAPPTVGSPVVDSPGSSSQTAEQKPEPTITEIMKSPSKVVLLRNMVGPGEVDEDLEPEVKDECNTKYGDVIKVLIFEQPNVPAEDAVRIFVEFKRIESAIKAVVDLNGRFFGGRQVKAGFYSWEKLTSLQLLD